MKSEVDYIGGVGIRSANAKEDRLRVKSSRAAQVACRRSSRHAYFPRSTRAGVLLYKVIDLVLVGALVGLVSYEHLCSFETILLVRSMSFICQYSILMMFSESTTCKGECSKLQRYQ